tara:strand:+ start:1000466 stop:1001833 length:1368 start_codon:yes stop_codon:yes gene_type:complete
MEMDAKNQRDESRNRAATQQRTEAAVVKRSPHPFGIVSLVKTPKEIIEEVIETRGLSPHQVRYALEGREAELVIGPFVIENPLGRGSWGGCSLAIQMNSGESVSLRCLPLSMNDGEKALAGALSRSREVEHPGLQRALRVGRHDGRLFIAHERCPGEDLNHYVGRKGRLVPAQAIDCVVQMARALQAAQRKGLFHGELRPTKLIVNQAGEVRIRETATANFMRQRRFESGNVASMLALVPVHHVLCAAPEAYQPGAKMDFRSDIYSLGCILSFLLTGKHAFAGSEAGRVVVAHRSCRPPSIVSKLYGITSQIDQLILKMLSKSPGDRFRTYDELLQALVTIQKSNGGLDAQTRQSWWTSIDDDWVCLSRERTAKLSRFRVSRIVAYGAGGLAGVATLVVAITGAVTYFGQEPPEVPPAPTRVVKVPKAEKGPRVFTHDPAKEVVTVEAEEVFRLP